MTPILAEALFVAMLIAANGAFAMSELAVISARKARLRQRAERGDHKARAALDLAEDPNRFLSTVQVGITLVSTLAGVFGGATIAESIAARLERVAALAPYAEAISLVVVVAGIAYVSLVFGELVPKRLAMSDPERFASAVAGPLRWLSAAGVPLVRLLSLSTEAVLQLLGVRPSDEPPVTQEEVNILLKEGTRAGIFAPAEQEMVRRALRLGGRRASQLMMPRNEVVWLDPSDSPEEVRRKVTGSPHSQFPVCDGSLDGVLGMVRAKDLLASGLNGRAFDIKGLLQVPFFIYEGTRGLRVLEMFRSSGRQVAIVLSEYGSVAGLLTPSDILKAIVGDLQGEAEAGDRRAVERPDGSWLVDGALAADEFLDLTEVARLPRGEFHTVAGLVLAQLGRIPAVADSFEWDGLKFEVVGMDGHRIDKVLVTPAGNAFAVKIPDRATREPRDWSGEAG